MAIESAKNSLTGGKGKRWSPLDSAAGPGGDSPLKNKVGGGRGKTTAKGLANHKAAQAKANATESRSKKIGNQSAAAARGKAAKAKGGLSEERKAQMKAEVAKLRAKAGSPVKNTGKKKSIGDPGKSTGTSRRAGESGQAYYERTQRRKKAMNNKNIAPSSRPGGSQYRGKD